MSTADDVVRESEVFANGEVVSGSSLEGLLKLVEKGQGLDPKLAEELGVLNRDLLAEIDPRDAIERMLAAQIIATFNRSMFLSRHANRQRHATWFALYSRECDRAMNLYRKQMLALAEYRRPRRTRFTSIRNANIAGQQVITTGEVQRRVEQRKGGERREK